MADKWVYAFGGGTAEGKGDQKQLLGGKGAGLAEMSRLGIPVPPGFTLTTAACIAYQKADGEYPEGLRDQVAEALARVEELQGRRFGDAAEKLLLVAAPLGGPAAEGVHPLVAHAGLPSVRSFRARVYCARALVDCRR
ncbi:MAG TPA: PEP/pyruvate-binding domain-containing protein, partial [Thermoanaerobaculia bacterium]|nr:PEP/pyruvate-binding domain-containing protein [Thermoanaerobaculia bacterium]